MRKKTIAFIVFLSTAMIITASVVRSNQGNVFFNANVEALTEDDEPGGGGGAVLRGHTNDFCDYLHNNGCSPIPCPIHG